MTDSGVDDLDDTADTADTADADTARPHPCDCGKYADRDYWPDWAEFGLIFLLVFGVMAVFVLLFLAFFSP